MKTIGNLQNCTKHCRESQTAVIEFIKHNAKLCVMSNIYSHSGLHTDISFSFTALK